MEKRYRLKGTFLAERLETKVILTGKRGDQFGRPGDYLAKIGQYHIILCGECVEGLIEEVKGKEAD